MMTASHYNDDCYSDEGDDCYDYYTVIFYCLCSRFMVPTTNGNFCHLKAMVKLLCLNENEEEWELFSGSFPSVLSTD